MNKSDWQVQINALLDEELSAAEIAALEQAASDSPLLAQELADARQLRQMLAGMPARQAPRQLRRKLQAISRPSAPWTPAHWSWLRRGVAIACLPLVLVVANLGDSNQPSAAEINQGRRELALALGYINQAGQRANIEINHAIGSGLIRPVNEQTLRTLSLPTVLRKEYLL
jgi:anti-sigma factor RsiW